MAISTADINASVLNSYVSNTRSGSILPLNSPAITLFGSTGNVTQEPLNMVTGALSPIVSDISKQVKATIAPVLNTITAVNTAVTFIASSVAEFSRISYASTTQSPLATAKQIRDLVCKALDFAKTFKPDLLAGFSFPPHLPVGLTSFSIRKFTTKLVEKIEEKIWAYIDNLVQSIINKIKAIYNKILSMINDIIEQFKQLFKCNPGDKK